MLDGETDIKLFMKWYDNVLNDLRRLQVVKIIYRKYSRHQKTFFITLLKRQI